MNARIVKVRTEAEIEMFPEFGKPFFRANYCINVQGNEYS